MNDETIKLLEIIFMLIGAGVLLGAGMFCFNSTVRLVKNSIKSNPPNAMDLPLVINFTGDGKYILCREVDLAVMVATYIVSQQPKGE